jgi:hypothetical protein
MRLAYLFAASSALLFACAAPASTSEEQGSSTSHIESEESAPSAIVVQQAERIFARRLGSDGSVLGLKVGEQSIMVGSDILLAQHDGEEGTNDCSFGGVSQTGKFISSELSLTDASGAKTVLVPAVTKSEGDFQVIQGAEIRGNLGPYLFVRQSLNYFGCGAAHPSFGRTAFVWDAKNQQKVAFDAPSAALDKAREALAGKGFDGEPKLAELVPQFDADGHFSIGYRFEKDASHAEADGEGNDYTVSATIDSKTLDAPLPAELEALKDPPAPVAAYIAATHDTSANPLLGWSTPE